jgi:CheY-like chemotaxis protein
MRRLLTRFGHHVTTADSVRAALDAAESRPPDLLISDIGLPDGNGNDVMRQIRQRRPGRPIPAIAVSGYGMEEDIRRSEQSGFAAHITKPIDPRRLQAVIASVTSDSNSESKSGPIEADRSRSSGSSR